VERSRAWGEEVGERLVELAECRLPKLKGEWLRERRVLDGEVEGVEEVEGVGGVWEWRVNAVRSDRRREWSGVGGEERG